MEERHTKADCSIQEHAAFCFCSKSNGKSIPAHSAQSRQFMVAMMCPDMYLELMPDEYLDRPLFAYFKVLDSDQRFVVETHYGSI